MKIAVIDYGAGNLKSICNALKQLGQEFEIVGRAQELGRFEKVVLPGVGAAKNAMKNLRGAGFAEVLPDIKVPFLGICLGLQLLADFSYEENVKCFRIIPGEVKKFPKNVKVPQIGWNKVNFVRKSALLTGVPDGSYFYFVNSFYFDAPEEFVVARTNYGVVFPSIVQKENFYATQFHPEKSGEIGFKLLRNFCEKC